MAGVERVELNSKGLSELLTGGDLYPALAEHAAVVEARAKANAAPHYRTGAYERSIHTERHRSPSRVVARVVADDEVSAILESRYHVMGRSAG